MSEYATGATICGSVAFVFTIAIFAMAVVAFVTQPSLPSAPNQGTATTWVRGNPTGQPQLGGAGLLAASGSGAANVSATRPATVTKNNVMPLAWDAAKGIYYMQFTAGESEVLAVLDTGSARCVLATPATAGPGVTVYTPPTGPGTQVKDPRTGGPCTASIAYVSQQDTVTVYNDTLTVPRVTIATPALCSGTPITQVVQAGAKGILPAPLSITDFPVSAITSGGASLNVLGMSAVQAVTREGSQYFLPSCQLSGTPQYESELIQALSVYDASAGVADVVWSMMLGTSPPAGGGGGGPLLGGFPVAGTVAFGPLDIPCLAPQYATMYPTLTHASSSLVNTPYRYYVVELTGCSIGAAGTDPATWTRTLPGFPKYVLVDSGTTQGLLPGPSGAANAAALNGLGPGDMAVIWVKGAAGGVIGITYTPTDVVYVDGTGSTQAVFAGMDAAPLPPDAPSYPVAQSFSSQMDVGILGNTALRNLYVEFNLTRHTIGFGQIAAAAPTS